MKLVYNSGDDDNDNHDGNNGSRRQQNENRNMKEEIAGKDGKDRLKKGMWMCKRI